MIGFAALLTALSACGSPEDGTSIVQIAPASPDVDPGGAVQFIANVAGTPETADWSVLEADGGTIDVTGNYTAPEAEGTYTILASLTSLATIESTQVRVKRNLRVNVSPDSATLTAGESIVLTASVTGNVKTVSWSVPEAPESGTVTSDGVYTAPQTAGTYDVVATSTADGTRSGVSTITVTAAPPPPPPPPTVAIAITPQTASTVAANTVQFSATITGSTNAGVKWSVRPSGGGNVSAAGLYTAPADAGSYQVVAASEADPSKEAVSTVTVAPALLPPPPTATPTGALLAFPGAQGGGAKSVGGRGGAVYAVTSLADTNTPGTLRYCISQSGPRTCVFRVAGTIVLTSTLTVTNPYLTVAGQTAPGGIQLSGKNITADMVRIGTHDVIWRYTRVNKGYTAGALEGPGSNIQISAGAYNVMIDHNSLLWTQDGNLDATTGLTNTTASYNLIAEPLAAHPFMMAFSGASSTSSDSSNLDMHNNYFANFAMRAPYSRLGKMRFYNNLIYNWDSSATRTTGGGDYDFVGNHWKRGPLSPLPGESVRGNYEVSCFLSSGAYGPVGNPTYYVSGNMGPNLSNPDGDNWVILRETSADGGGSEIGPVSTAFRRNSPLTSWGAPMSAEPVRTLATNLLPVVGASRRLDCSGNWVNARDAADARIVGDWSDGGGTIPASETDVGGFPTQMTGPACADADLDGMPDAFEIANGLNPSNAADRNAIASGQV